MGVLSLAKTAPWRCCWIVLLLGNAVTVSAQDLPSIPTAPPVTVSPPPVVPPNTLPPNFAPPTVVPPSSTIAVEDPFLGPRPLPGSLQDEFTREYEARSTLRTLTWDDGILTALPSTLLWEPGLAVHRDPRMKTLGSNQANFRSGTSLETSIGGTVGLFRFEPAGSSWKFQTDIFGVVHTRLSPEDVTVADYRFGLPFTFQWNWWHGKFGYEHTSSHIGDRLIRATGAQVFTHAKDEVVAGLGRWLFDDTLRIYGNIAYAFFDLNPDRVKGPFRGDVGFEWYSRKATGFAGTPFLAGNVEFRQDQSYEPNYTIQAGWMWRNPYQRFGSFRLFAEYYRGGSPYGQFYRTKENFAAFGIAFDY
jgi:hypothetical protein